LSALKLQLLTIHWVSDDTLNLSMILMISFLDQFERLETLYYDLHNRIHRNSRPLKLIYEMREHEIQLAWVTTNYELYATFDPLVDKKSAVIAQVNKLLKWIKKEEEKLFMTGTHVF
jgi:vacuolar fusion protein MON1